MRLQTSDEVWARIRTMVDAAGERTSAGVVATDGDGTLWSGDVGDDLFHAFCDHGEGTDSALDALRREAREHALSDAGGPADVARRIHDAFLQGHFPEERLYELMTWCYAGWTRERMQAFARDVVLRGRLEARFHGEVLHVLDHARAAGLETVLVSASPMAVVVEAGALAGFAPGQIVAALPRFEGDVMLAEVERPIPYGAGKVSRLLERVGRDRTLYAAFGDNAFDVALLASARVGVAVRPKPRLRERAHEVAGLVELEPRLEKPGDRC